MKLQALVSVGFSLEVPEGTPVSEVLRSIIGDVLSAQAESPLDEASAIVSVWDPTMPHSCETREQKL